MIASITTRSQNGHFGHYHESKNAPMKRYHYRAFFCETDHCEFPEIKEVSFALHMVKDGIGFVNSWSVANLARTLGAGNIIAGRSEWGDRCASLPSHVAKMLNYPSQLAKMLNYIWVTGNISRSLNFSALFTESGFNSLRPYNFSKHYRSTTVCLRLS